MSIICFYLMHRDIQNIGCIFYKLSFNVNRGLGARLVNLSVNLIELFTPPPRPHLLLFYHPRQSGGRPAFLENVAREDPATPSLSITFLHLWNL